MKPESILTTLEQVREIYTATEAEKPAKNEIARPAPDLINLPNFVYGNTTWHEMPLGPEQISLFHTWVSLFDGSDPENYDQTTIMFMQENACTVAQVAAIAMQADSTRSPKLNRWLVGRNYNPNQINPFDLTRLPRPIIATPRSLIEGNILDGLHRLIAFYIATYNNPAYEAQQINCVVGKLSYPIWLAYNGFLLLGARYAKKVPDKVQQDLIVARGIQSLGAKDYRRLLAQEQKIFRI